jgi:hypothetical protein
MFTAEQLLRLRNFGQKSLDEVKHALEQHSFSLHIGPPEPRLLLSFPRVDARFNLGLSTAKRTAKVSRRTPFEISAKLRNV